MSTPQQSLRDWDAGYTVPGGFASVRAVDGDPLLFLLHCVNKLCLEVLRKHRALPRFSSPKSSFVKGTPETSGELWWTPGPASPTLALELSLAAICVTHTRRLACGGVFRIFSPVANLVNV